MAGYILKIKEIDVSGAHRKKSSFFWQRRRKGSSFVYLLPIT